MKSKLSKLILGVSAAILLSPGPAEACLSWYYDCLFFVDSYGAWDPEYGIVCQGSGGGCWDCYCICGQTGQPFPC